MQGNRSAMRELVPAVDRSLGACTARAATFGGTVLNLATSHASLSPVSSVNLLSRGLGALASIVASDWTSRMPIRLDGPVGGDAAREGACI